MVLEQDCENGYPAPNLWADIMINYLLLPFQTLTFHASYIEYQGQGILFTAPSGTGKSTQAELWRKHRGAMVINGDKAAVRLTEKGAIAYSIPISGTSGICHNISCPLKAIVSLSQAPENKVQRMKASQAVSALFQNVFVDKAVLQEWQTALGLLLDLVTSVPVYSLACTPDVRAVEALEEMIREPDNQKEGFV